MAAPETPHAHPSRSHTITGPQWHSPHNQNAGPALRLVCPHLKKPGRTPRWLCSLQLSIPTVFHSQTVGLGQRNAFLSRYPLPLPNLGAPALDVMDICPTGVTSPACQDRPASFVSRALLLARPLPPAAHPLTPLPFCLWTWGQECQGDSTSSFPAQPLGTHGQPGPSSGLSTLGAQRPIQRLCLLTTVRASCPTCPQQASPSLQPAPPHLSPRLAPPLATAPAVEERGGLPHACHPPLPRPLPWQDLSAFLCPPHPPLCSQENSDKLIHSQV